ncbi:MAG: hypothetical protein H6R18_2524 [Proteobacteria bacterium]|nr:hypothetical protein [Pseudomonadota bacterium]
MEINNTSSATSAGVQAQRTLQSQPSERREPKAEERVEQKEEVPRPVTNAQGQTTGTVINVTA